MRDAMMTCRTVITLTNSSGCFVSDVLIKIEKQQNEIPQKITTK